MERSVIVLSRAIISIEPEDNRYPSVKKRLKSILQKILIRYDARSGCQRVDGVF